VADLHKRYGAVVRIGPNELSYIREDAWKDIYGTRSGEGQLMKDPTTAANEPGSTTGLFLAPTAEDHSRMRRNLNPGFSERALREQEPVIMTYIDLLIE
jgi:cytochrome P450